MSYGYNHYNSPENKFNRLPMEEKLQRQQTVYNIIAVVPDLSYLPSCPDIYYNTAKYSNQFLESVTMEYTYCGGVDDKSENRKKFQELWAQYSKEVKRINEELKRINEEAAAQYNQYIQANNPQNYSAYPPAPEGQPNYQQPYGQPQNYQQQSYNYQQQPYQYNQPQNYPPEQFAGYQNYQETTQYGTEGNDGRNQNYNQRRQNKEHGQYEHREKGKRRYDQKRQNKKYEEPQVKKEEPPPPPPKPEPKPTKFSISKIKELINSYSKEDLEKLANPEVVTKVQEIKAWKCEEVEIKFREQPPSRYEKKGSKREEGKNTNFNMGSRQQKDIETAKNLGYKPKEDPKVQLVIGAKQTIETRIMRDDIKKKAKNYEEEMVKETQSKGKLEQDRIQIVYNLNLIVPENLKLVEKDILPYLYENEQICKILIEEIINKAWGQPKYASTYAKLCQDFTKKNPVDFKFKAGNKDKENPFKFLLVEKVQHFFDEKLELFPNFQTPEDKELYLKNVKQKIMSNVKFLAELIICKILKKMIIKYCIEKLLSSFLTHYYNFKQKQMIEDSIFDFHYEAIIEFIENIGEKYESIEEKQKQNKQSPYEEVKKHVEGIISLKNKPEESILEKLGNLSKEEYFWLLIHLDKIFIKDNFSRLSALLQNLIERRENGWYKHLSTNEGPLKLGQTQQDEATTKANKEKAEQQRLDKKVKELFEGWESNKKQEEKQLKDIFKSFSDHQFYISFLKQIADEKKDLVIKRVELFGYLIERQKFSFKDFRSAWFSSIRHMAFMSGDFPFCGAAFAKVLVMLLEKDGKVGDYFEAFEDEDEEFFMEEIIQKYHFYSQDEGALKFVKPKKRYSGML